MNIRWSEKNLGELCDVVAGQSPDGTHYNDVGEGLPFYQGKKEFGPKFIGPPQKWTRESKKEAVEGDILMSVRAPVGPINFSTQRICIGRGLAAIRPGNLLDRDFLFYALLSKQSEISGSEGAVFASINQRQIKAIRLPCPPLPEQKRIVAILDEAFEGIDAAVANAEKNLANARELFESYLNSVFSQGGKGWREGKLDAIGGVVSTGPFGSLLHKSDYVEGGTPLVNPANIIADRIEPDTRKTVDSGALVRLKAYVLKDGDIVIGRRGEIGRCAVVTSEQSGWLCGTGSFFIRPFAGVTPAFLAHLIRSPSYREKLEKMATGATMLNLSNQSLSQLKIALPAESEQRRVLKQLDDLLEKSVILTKTYSKKIAALAHLKQSILHKAFSGELTAQPEQALSQATA